MPLSRSTNGRILLESIFDKANRGEGSGVRGPRVLYHYTTWEAAESIIASQTFRASAHDCTNDTAELQSADATIIEAVRAARERADSSVIARRVLGLFLDTYDDSRIAASRRAYLVCFSSSRDDPHQWCRYGQRGAGVCLGLRLLGIGAPVIEGVSTQYIPVDYRESYLREKVDAWLNAFITACARAADIERNWRLAIDALNVSATAWALAAKKAEWSPEQEIRAIYFAREGARIVPIEEQRPDGSLKRYCPVRVTRRRRMPVQELIIGPSQDVEAGRARALHMFTAARYQHPDRKAVASTAHLVCEGSD